MVERKDFDPTYDKNVINSIKQFIKIDLADNDMHMLKNIPMTKAVQGYHCDYERHGPNQRRFLFEVFQSYGDDHYRRSYHYDDRVYVEVQFQILRAMQEVQKHLLFLS